MQTIYASVPIHVGFLSLTRSKSYSFTISIIAICQSVMPCIYSVQSKGQRDGEVLTVLPSQNMVVAWKGNSASSGDFPEEMNSLLKILIDTNMP